MSVAKDKLMKWLVKEKDSGLKDVKFFVSSEARNMTPDELADQINRFDAAPKCNASNWNQHIEKQDVRSLMT
ncbi:MAG: hypothetical protein COA93_07160 [Alphaproteobacteria bacterium]|nr:MAG: hypothetical protein COA93_07160 [Alphaproteobacteria bacterium]